MISKLRSKLTIQSVKNWRGRDWVWSIHINYEAYNRSKVAADVKNGGKQKFQIKHKKYKSNSNATHNWNKIKTSNKLNNFTRLSPLIFFQIL